MVQQKLTPGGVPFKSEPAAGICLRLPIVRSRFRHGWGLAGGLAGAAIMLASQGNSSSIGNASATVVAHPDPLFSGTTGTIVLFAGCAIAAGAGSFLATTALNMSDRSRLGSALMWAAIGLLTVAANVYFLSFPGPDWWYESAARGTGDGPVAVRILTRRWSPVMAHLIVTLPVAGALGGFLQSLVTPATTAAGRLIRAVVWMLIWATAFAAARFVAVIGIYLLSGGVTDLFEAVGMRALIGGLIGTFLGGYLAGYVAGAIASFSPGIEWATGTRRT
jgi:hypothetical protein